MSTATDGFGTILRKDIAFPDVVYPAPGVVYASIGDVPQVVLQEAIWNRPAGMVLDADGYFWVGNQGSAVVRKVNASTLDVRATIDLTPYNPYPSNDVTVRSNYVSGRYVFICGMQSQCVYVIEAATNTVVGTAVLPDDSVKCRSCVLDADGNLWVVGIKNSGSNSKLYKFSSFLSLGCTPVAVFNLGYHVEDITFGFGYLWGGSGTQGSHKLYRFDPNTPLPAISYTGSDNLWDAHIAFGSVWSAGAAGIYRFDPATFPSDPIAVIPVSSGYSFFEITHDATTLWVVNGFNNDPTLVRVDVTLGDEAIIAQVTVDPLHSDAPVSPTWDGTNIWFCNRSGETDNQGSLVKVDTTLGSEAFVLAFRGPLAFEYVSGGSSPLVYNDAGGPSVKSNIVTTRTAAGSIDNTNQGITDIGTGSSVSGNFGTVSGGRNNTVVGNFATASGDGCSAASSGCVAMGLGCVADGYGSAAFGNGSHASGQAAIAVGAEAAATGDYAAAFGASTYAAGRGSFAAGEGTHATGDYSFTAGWVCTASDYSIAMGQGCTASGAFSVSIGDNSSSTAEDSVSLGVSATASGAGSLAVNGGASSGASSTAIGIGAVASGAGSFAFGTSTTTSGYGSVAFGVLCTASSAAATAIGYQCIASASNSTAIGYQCQAASSGAFAGGENSTASAQRSTAFGQGCNASGGWSFAVGQGCVASGNHSCALGASVASGPSSFAGGASHATTDYATAFGLGVASGFGSFAAGSAAAASGFGSSAFGAGTASGQFSNAMGAGVASGQKSHAFQQGTASAIFAVASGENTVANRPGQVSHGQSVNGGLVPLKQISYVDMGGITLGSVATESVGLSFADATIFVCEANRAYNFEVKAIVTTSTGTTARSFVQRATVVTDSSGIPTLTGTNTQDSYGSSTTWTMALSVNTGDHSFRITIATGGTQTALRVEARVEFEEVKFA